MPRRGLRDPYSAVVFSRFLCEEKTLRQRVLAEDEDKFFRRED